MIVDPLALEHRKPRRAFNVLATILVPGNVELGFLVVAQHIGGHERADVQADAIVEVGVPADGLLGQRLPADEDVVGRFAFEDGFEPGLEITCSGQARLGTVDAVLHAFFLAADPVAEIGVDQTFEVLVIEPMVIHQGTETVFQAVPDVPDEGAVVEAPGVLLEEFLAQPDVQRFAGAVGVGEQFIEDGRLPASRLDGFPGVDQQRQQALVGGLFAAYGGQADDADVVGVDSQGLAAGDPGASLVGEFDLVVRLGRPGVPK